MANTVRVQIKSWDKFNPRKDVKQSSWFRLDHSVIDSDEFYDFTHEEFRAWIYVLCQASKKNSGEIVVNFEKAHRVSRITPAGFRSALKKLSDLEIVTVDVTETSRERNVHVSLRDETDVTNDPSGGNNLAHARLVSPVANFIATYVKAYEQRYPGSRPEITGKVQGQIKSIVKSLGLDRARELIQVYCQLEVPWFITKGHDFTTFMENLNVVSRARDTGQMPPDAKGVINWSQVTLS
jgi:hypothetical protein